MSAKSKKKGEKILMMPGPTGWEIWSGSNGAGLALKTQTGERLALDVDGLPSGEITMAFPVRDASALPFLAPTTDEALFTDLADMHVERLGMRPAVEAGVLTDCFKVGTRGENSLLLPVVLAPPPEGHLPKRSPHSFDISARCLTLPQDGAVVWRELGRWVFAVSEEGVAMHFQALASTKLGEDAGREIKISISQLELQGLIASAPRHCFVWVGDGEAGPDAEELENLGRGFGGSAMVAEKPAPFIPAKASHLLPADVRAERVAKRQKQQMRLAVVALVVAWVGLVGWGVWTLMEAKKDVRAAKNEYNAVAPEVEGLKTHIKKWEELKPVVELEHWPVELLLSASKARPDQGLRLELAEVYNSLEVGEGGTLDPIDRSIRLQGMADELDQVNTFDVNLRKSSALREYDWNNPPATEEPKSGRWKFLYDGKFIN